MAGAAEQRIEQALLALARDEFAGPAAAISGYAEILIAEATRSGQEHLLPDLDRIRKAATQLSGLIATLLSNRADGRDPRDLRHDLRTPLNAIKGYGELLIEDTAEGPLGEDLERLLGTAEKLLRGVDRLVEGAGMPATEALSLVNRTFSALLPVDGTAPATETGRILVVDDNEANRDLLCRRLALDGHETAAAEDGSAARAIGIWNFDLVLLDLMMPGISGFEVLQHLKGDPATSHIPVIMISALDEQDSAVRCIEAGAEDYLPKPCDPVLLRARIAASLERKHLRDREARALAELKAEKARSETLLRNILPKPIIERLQRDERQIADKIAAVSILFCDLARFTTLSESLSASAVIDLLNGIFSRFDSLAAALGLEKIKTIGDCYMAAAGLPEPRPDHAGAAADMALAMIGAIAEESAARGLSVEARIGIHSGPAIAGIIGTHKFVYDVWGDTVNIASRMESHGVPGRVQISAATKEMLGGAFRCEPRGRVEIKGKGQMETYFLEGRR